MPTYEYACKSCEEHIDVVQSFGDAPLTVCPACGGELRKVFGAVGVVFKGSGFYKTDSRPASKKSGGTASSDGSGERAKEVSSNGSSDSSSSSDSGGGGSSSSSGSGGTGDATTSSGKTGSGATGKAAAAS